MARQEKLEYEVEELDGLIDHVAASVEMVFFVVGIIEPLVALGLTASEAASNQVLVGAAMKYWPGIIEYEAMWGVAEKLALRDTALELLEHLLLKRVEGTVKDFLKQFSVIFEPSYIARGWMTTTPEEEFAARRLQILEAGNRAVRLLQEHIGKLDSQILLSQTVMNELVAYISACEAIDRTSR